MSRSGPSAPGLRKRRSRKTLLLGLLFSGTMLSAVARAQETSLATAPPPKIPVDAHGVDVVTGDFNTTMPLISIGPQGAGGLSVTRTFFGTGWRASYIGRVSSGGGANVVVNNGGATEIFTQSGSIYTSQNGGASTLTYDGKEYYTYTLANGTVVKYANDNVGYYDGLGQSLGLISQLEKPDGEIDTYTYEQNLCTNTLVAKPVPPPGGSSPASTAGTASTSPDADGNSSSGATSSATPAATACRNAVRLDQIASNTGYAINLSYAASGPNPGPAFLQLTGLAGVNTAASSSAPLPSTSLNNVGASDMISDGFVTRKYNYNTAGRIISFESPAGTTATTITYDGSGRVYTYNDPYSAYTYTYSTSGTQQTTTVAGPTGNKVYVSNTSPAVVMSYTDELNRATAYAYDGYGRLTQVTRPENDLTKYAYDARGNVTSTTVVPKVGSNLASIVTQANYDTTCSNVVKCNRPNYTIDARGYQTNYVYDATHGGPTSVTSPAAGPNNVQPQVRYGYTPYSTSNGNVYRLTSTSTCLTAASCINTADESRTTVAYGTNLLASSVTIAAGDGSVSATTALTWSPAGDVTYVDGPLAGTADTTEYRYGSAHQILGMVGPDPDGAGSLHNRAQRYTYDGAGRLTLTEFGTTNSQSDADWANFNSIQQASSTYAASGNKLTDAAVAAGAPRTLVQYSYNYRGLLQCTAMRDPSLANSLPASACTTTGSTLPGADRIGQTNYDVAGQVISRVNGLGTADVATEFAATYGADGEQVTASDANSNTTQFEYDGFNRLARIDFPGTSPNSPAINGEVYTYDAASNVVTKQLRGGLTVTNSYDALGRLTYAQHPVPSQFDDDDVSYTWGNLGQLLATARTAGTPGINSSFGYDALGRLTTQTSVQGTVTTAYDAAGNRTRLTWPGSDNFYVTYDHDYTGEVTAIRENGAASGPGVLETINYDDLGRRTSLVRGNGTSTSYGWDLISRFSSLTHSLSGASQSESVGYDASSEVTSRNTSNDGWAWTGAYNVNRSYSIDGLNQPTTSGSLTLSWGAAGGLTSDGVNSFTYDAANRLTLTQGKAVAYDGAGRVWSAGVPGAATRFLYDGQEAIAEYTVSGTLLRRYVHGPGVDEPLVWYEINGSTTQRSHLYADRQGSIVATANDAGSLTAINAYDEYGLPNNANGTIIGRFGYTGQKYLSEVGLYDFKARVYSPTLGRFMSPDPTGYSDGLNFYNYAHSDPVDGSDPSGLGSRACGGTVVYGADNSITFTLNGCENGLEQPGPGNLSEPGSTDGGNSQRPDRPSPQNVVAEVVVTAKRRSPSSCAASALGSNGVTLGLDALSFGASFLPGESQAVALGQLALSTGSLLNGAVGGDLRGIGIGIVGYHLAGVGPLAGQSAQSATASVARSLARALPGVGVAVSFGALVLDSATAIGDYQKCLSGG